MKRIHIYKLGDDIPNDANFLFREKGATKEGDVATILFVYEVPFKEKTEEQPKSAKYVQADSLITDIIIYLNERTGKSFKTTSRKTRTIIRARMNEGFGWHEFCLVIQKKAHQWLDDPKMNTYLRPATLFAEKHFESYLNEKSGDEMQDSAFKELDKIIEGIDG